MRQEFLMMLYYLGPAFSVLPPELLSAGAMGRPGDAVRVGLVLAAPELVSPGGI